MIWTPLQITRGNIVSDTGALWFSPMPGNLVKSLKSYSKVILLIPWLCVPAQFHFFLFHLSSMKSISGIVHILSMDLPCWFSFISCILWYPVFRIAKGPYIGVTRSHRERTKLDRCSFVIWLIFILSPHCDREIPYELFQTVLCYLFSKRSSVYWQNPPKSFNVDTSIILSKPAQMTKFLELLLCFC